MKIARVVLPDGITGEKSFPDEVFLSLNCLYNNCFPTDLLFGGLPTETILWYAVANCSDDDLGWDVRWDGRYIHRGSRIGELNRDDIPLPGREENLGRLPFTASTEEEAVPDIPKVIVTACLTNNRKIFPLNKLSESESHYLLFNVGTHPLYRRKGYMKRLLQLLLASIPGSTVYLEIDLANTAAYQLYLSLGFTLVFTLTQSYSMMKLEV